MSLLLLLGLGFLVVVSAVAFVAMTIWQDERRTTAMDAASQRLITDLYARQRPVRAVEVSEVARYR